MGSNQRKIGVVLSYVSQLISILSGLIYTPIMLRLLGQNEYGLYQLVSSVIAYLGLLNFGFGSAYVRFFSIEKAGKDKENGVAKVNGMFFSIFAVISFICFICGSIMIGNMRGIFGTGLTEAELSKARILMIFMIFNLIVSMLVTVFSCYVSANEQFFFQRVIGIAQSLLNPFLTLPLLLMGYGSVGMVVICTVLTCADALVNITFCFKKLHMKFNFRGFEFSKLKEMWVFTFFIFLNQIVDQVNWSIDKFLLGRMAGTAVVAIYGVGGNLNTMYMRLSTSISGVFAPMINRIVATDDDNEELTKIFTKVGRMQCLLLMLVLSGFVIFGKPFIRLWAGADYDDAYIVTLLLIAPFTVPLIQNIGIDVQRAKNKHKTRSVVYLIMAFGHIGISFLLIPRFGAIGAAAGTAISMTLANGLFMNWYYHARIGINILYFWKQILMLLRGMIPCIIFAGLFMKFYAVNSWITLIIGAGIYALCYALSMWFLGMNEYEKGMVNKILVKFKK